MRSQMSHGLACLPCNCMVFAVQVAGAWCSRLKSRAKSSTAVQEEEGAHAPAWKPTHGARTVATPSVVIMNLR